MRVYGTSPLYNYVELVFRSKRLFIASILIATLAMIGVVATKSSSYTAEATVLLAGDPNLGPQALDETQAGSVKYKINMLSVLTRNRQFMRDAMDKAKLTQGMSGTEADDFAQKATKALNFSTGDSVLQISCRWPDRRADKIVQAFYDAYKKKVVDSERTYSNMASQTVLAARNSMNQELADIDNKISDYNSRHKGIPITDFSTANQQFINQQQVVSEAQAQVQSGQLRLSKVEQQIAATQKNITTSKTIGYDVKPESPALTAARMDIINVQDQIDEEINIKKHTPDNPYVLKLKTKLDMVKAKVNKLAKIEAPRPSANGHLDSEKQSINPSWQALDTERTNLSMALTDAKARVAAAQAQEVEFKRLLDSATPEQIKYNEIVKNRPMIAGMRDQLQSKLLIAQLEEEKDKQLKQKQVEMMIEPISEPDATGGKGTIMLLAAGPLLGLIIAFAFSLVTENMDHSLRTPLEVEKHLGKPVLAVLPRMDSKDARRPTLEIGGGSANLPPSLPS